MGKGWKLLFKDFLPITVRIRTEEKKSCILETPKLSTDADRSTNIFVSAGVKKRADSNFFVWLFLFFLYSRIDSFVFISDF